MTTATTPTMRTSPDVDNEYAQWLASLGGASGTPSPTPNQTLDEMRKSNDAMVGAVFSHIPPQASIQQTLHTIASYDGAPINTTRFGTLTTGRQPALLHFHGGGMVSGSVALHAPRIVELAATSGVQVFSVDYRKAPEHAYPTPVEDGYAALKWLSSNAGSLGVDAARIGVYGDSSGGGLAAGIALLARDRALDPPLRKQILIYPMLDDRSIASWAPDSRSATLLTMCWKAYLGEDKAGKAGGDVSPYAAPGRAEDLDGLPGTYIEVGGLDEFRDECVGYASKLARAGNAVEFHLWKGVPHGFDVAEIGITRRAVEGRVTAVKEL